MTTARLYALYRLGALYHSGQNSPGYRLLCRAGKALRRIGIALPLDQIKPRNAPQTFRDDLAREFRRFKGFRKEL